MFFFQVCQLKKWKIYLTRIQIFFRKEQLILLSFLESLVGLLGGFVSLEHLSVNQKLGHDLESLGELDLRFCSDGSQALLEFLLIQVLLVVKKELFPPVLLFVLRVFLHFFLKRLEKTLGSREIL